MTTGDDQTGHDLGSEEQPAAAPDEAQDHVDGLVDDLFREVDDHFSDLERQYQAAKAGLTASPASSDPLVTDDGDEVDPIAASQARYELISEVATLRAEVERQADELDERDRLLAELSERIASFEAEIADGRDAGRLVEALQQELLDERRELHRVRALLDARDAERAELTSVAKRLQSDKDQLDDMLVGARGRLEEVERTRSELVERVDRLETARISESSDHENRQQDLVDAKTEVTRLQMAVEELTAARDEAVKRADKAESREERRGNEINYLNRRIEALSDKAAKSDEFEAEARRAAEERTRDRRRIAELERDLEAVEAQATASAAAVEAIADRSAQHDDLIARIAELEAAAVRREATPIASRAEEELAALAERARELGSRRAREPEPGQDAAPTAPQFIIEGPTDLDEPAAVAPALLLPEPEPDAEAEAVAESGGPSVQAPMLELPEVDDSVGAVDAADKPLAVEESFAEASEQAAAAPALLLPEVEPPFADGASVTPAAGVDTDGIPQIDVPEVEVPQIDVPEVDVPVIEPLVAGSVDGDQAPVAAVAGSLAPQLAVAHSAGADGRRRVVLPDELQPDTAEAVEHLLAQPQVAAIVDARSFCARTGVRPSELFDRLTVLRDRFDLPIDVVCTPVSTPVSGAPVLPAIGVHHISGADTVADRVRSLCRGFPADQPIVVIAGDDHVRRAAIAEEANVVDPPAIIAVT